MDLRKFHDDSSTRLEARVVSTKHLNRDSACSQQGTLLLKKNHGYAEKNVGKILKKFSNKVNTIESAP